MNAADAGANGLFLLLSNESYVRSRLIIKIICGIYAQPRRLATNTTPGRELQRAKLLVSRAAHRLPPVTCIEDRRLCQRQLPIPRLWRSRRSHYELAGLNLCATCRMRPISEKPFATRSVHASGSCAGRPHPTPPPLFWGREVPKK